MTSQSTAYSLTALPYRGRFGEPRPPALAGLRLPPGELPGRDGLRPLKCWRWIGVFAPEAMLCACELRIGPARRAFWSLWHRQSDQLHEGFRRSEVRLSPGRLAVWSGEVEIDLCLSEVPGIETVCRHGGSYAWTSKQGGIAARGSVRIGSEVLPLNARAVIDDSAGYHARRTHWRWSAGVGTAVDGRELAWNLVQGINDPDRGSERTVWVGGEALEPPPSRFSPDLRRVDGLRFQLEADRRRRENRLLVSSDLRQPFGSFAGQLPGGLELAQGLGVMEEHDVRW